MRNRIIGQQAQAVLEASQCVETLSGLLERHMVAAESGHGPVLNPGEVGGIIQALRMAGRNSEIASERLLDVAQGGAA